jgi:GNAT superfamily N-acetyltransferase
MRVRDCAEINGLGVVRRYQGKGVGSRLIAEAESLSRGRGVFQIGVAIGTDNTRAASLYDRLGYADWGKGNYVTAWTEVEAGRERVVREHVRYLLKQL